MGSAVCVQGPTPTRLQITDRTTAEIAAWHNRVDAEISANETADDEAADSVRRTAVDGRGLIDA